MKFSLEYVHSNFGKVAVICMVALLIWCLWPRGTKQINKPVVSGVAFPGSYVAPDQRATQIQVTEKPWEVGVDVFGGQFEDKDFYGVRVGVKYKF